jgi:hypothetical protein
MKTEDNNLANDAEENREEFPGYPPYPPEDDIMNHDDRIDANLEDSPVTDLEKSRATVPAEEEEIDAEGDDESNVTKEDIEALGSKDLSLDGGDDELLENRETPVDFAGSDLDVPGSELDDASEEVGSEDEENNNYSLGGDNHQDLDEDKA